MPCDDQMAQSLHPCSLDGDLCCGVDTRDIRGHEMLNFVPSNMLEDMGCRIHDRSWFSKVGMPWFER
jgi:hypothetical protein